MERYLRLTKSSDGSDDRPLALARDGAHGPVVHAVSRAAETAGVQIGARVVDMQALCPTLLVVDADVDGDLQALGRLAFWARRWCPWSALDGEDGLVLDTTGSDHLFGREVGLLADIIARLAAQGLTAEVAIAPTWGSAWGFARFRPGTICPPDRLRADFSALPINALRLDEATLGVLRRLGLKSVGAVMDIPRLSLTRRFARAQIWANPLMRLDQAMGRAPEPISSVAEPARLRAAARLAEPVIDPGPHLPDLAASLCILLEREGRGARRLRLLAYRTDGEVAELWANTSTASRSTDHLVWLLSDKLEALNPGFGFDLLVLEAVVSEPIQTDQTQLGGQDTQAEVSALIDRLSARLGARAVTRPVLRESHIPERAEAWVTALAPPPDDADAPPSTTPRPTRVLDRPEEIRVLYAVPEGPPAQFIWRRQTHKVMRYEGPERIAPEWWHDTPGTRLRDYYRIETNSWQRFWIYREGVIGDGRGDVPRWFLHGFFI